MSSATPNGACPKRAQALFGVLCLAAGLGGLAALTVAVYGADPADQALALRLGLAGSLLASAIAQVLVLIGGWALWRGLRRRP